jgi:type I restriction enzyme S subunit
MPPPSEQAAIVRFLDWASGRLERAIRAKRKIVALLNEQKQAIIHRAVTRGLDPSVPLKPSGIPWLGEIPAHWEVVTLKSVCLVQSGVTLGKNYSGQELHEYPYLRVANVQAGYVKLDVIKKIQVTRAEADRCTLQSGDVLMTEGGDLDKLGRGCVWKAQVTPCLHQNHVFAVRPNKLRLEPSFLSAIMGTGYARAYFQSTAKQTTNLAATNKTKLGMLKVLLPSVREQQQILTVIEEDLSPLNTAISRLEREIDLLREYRTRLVADVVTGKLDVREAAAALPDEAPLDDATASPDTDDDALDTDDLTETEGDA